MYKIGIDNGNKNTKTAHTVFSSGILQVPCKPALTDDWLCFEEKYYCLSPQRLFYTRDKTKDERFFLLSLFAIAKEMRARGEKETTFDVILGVGLPPEHLAELQDRFRDYFVRENVRFTHSGTEYCVSIKKAVVFPQGYSAVISKLMEKGNPYISQRTTYIVDIGGYTVDVIELNKGVVNAATCQSKDAGVIPLYNEITNRLRARNIKVTESLIDAILTGDMAGLSFSADAVEYVKTLAQQHVDNLLRELKEEGYGFDTCFTFFVGGGAILLRNLIKKSEFVGKCSISPSVFANAKGYEFLLRQFLK